MASWIKLTTVVCSCTGLVTITSCRSSGQRRSFTPNGACCVGYATKGARQQASGLIRISNTLVPAQQSILLKCFFDLTLKCYRSDEDEQPRCPILNAVQHRTALL